MEDRGSYNYRWIIVGVTFLTLGLTTTIMYSFSIFFVALLKEFRWSRSITAGAYSLFFILYGVIGPFAGNTVDRLGPRRVFVLGSLPKSGKEREIVIIPQKVADRLREYITSRRIGSDQWIFPIP
jgi:MFS family permease